jgi:hypothetical protein
VHCSFKLLTVDEFGFERIERQGNAPNFWQAYPNATLHTAAIELQQFIPVSNHTANSNQPASL